MKIGSSRVAPVAAARCRDRRSRYVIDVDQSSAVSATADPNEPARPDRPEESRVISLKAWTINSGESKGHCSRSQFGTHRLFGGDLRPCVSVAATERRQLVEHGCRCRRTIDRDRAVVDESVDTGGTGDPRDDVSAMKVGVEVVLIGG